MPTCPGTGLSVEGGAREEEGKQDANMYVHLRSMVLPTGGCVFWWGQCLGEDAPRREHFSGVWMPGRISPGKVGKQELPAAGVLLQPVCLEKGYMCVFGGEGVRLEI